MAARPENQPEPDTVRRRKWYDQSPAYTGQYYAGLYDRAPWGAARPLDSIGLVGTMAHHQPIRHCLLSNQLHRHTASGRPLRQDVLVRSELRDRDCARGDGKALRRYVVQPFTQTNPAAHVENGVALVSSLRWCSNNCSISLCSFLTSPGWLRPAIVDHGLGGGAIRRPFRLSGAYRL